MMTKSRYQELCEYIPAGVNSPANAFVGMGVEPFVVEKGEGGKLYDTEGNSYIDLCCSWGALIHGHAHPVINAAVKQQIDKGTTYGLSGTSVLHLAEKITKHIPSMEKMRFVSSGTEATSAAVRLARGATGKNLIVKFTGNFHGHNDQFLVKAGSAVANLSEASSKGVPHSVVAQTISLPYNDIESVESFFAKNHDIAGVIVEPVAGNMGIVPATQEFLETLRKLTQKAGAVLIFDEVINGYRMGLGGAQAYYGIDADIICLGKIIGGGFPAAAFGGRRELMDHLAPLGPVFQAGTLSGNPVAMEAGYQAVKLCEADGFYEEMKRKAMMIVNPIKKCIEENHLNACVQHCESLFTPFLGVRRVQQFDDLSGINPEAYASLFRHMLSKGIYVPPSQYEAWFVSSAHTDEELEAVKDAFVEFLSVFKT